MLLGTFWTAVYNALDSAFALYPGEDEVQDRLAARDTVYARMRARLREDVGPRLQTRDPRLLAGTRFDNALLLARRIYLTDLELFERVYEREGRDLGRAIERVVALAESRPDDPYGALRGWLGAALRTARSDK